MSRVVGNARSELAEIHEAARRGPNGRPLEEMVRTTIASGTLVLTTAAVR